MKLFFFLFFVVFRWPDNHALQCVDHADQLSFTADQLDEMENFINDLDLAGENEVCSVQYAITYPEKNFTLLFGGDVSNVSIDANTDLVIKIELTMAANGSAIDPGVGRKTFVYKCDDEDACERHFWRNHIDLLAEEDSTRFETALRAVFIRGIQEQVQCKVGNGETQGICSAGACIRITSAVAQSEVRGCANEAVHETSFILTAHVRLLEDDMEENGVAMRASVPYFAYVCQFENCNDESAENEISSLFTAQNVGLPSVYDAFVATLEEKQSTEPPSESSSTTIGQSDASTFASPQPGSTTGNPSPSAEATTTTFNPTITTTTTTSNSTETSRPNASIVHFISMNILILHLVFLYSF